MKFLVDERRVAPWLFVCFFVSGASALTYEVIWTRMLGWLFGTTIFAISTAVAAFMAGLALGSWWGGRLVDRQPHVLRMYAAMEAGMGILGWAITRLLPHLSPVSIFLERSVPPALAPPLHFLFLFGLLLIPTTLMGATLPVLARYLSLHHASLGRMVARLYSWNTWGAVCGALATDFWLIPAVGIAQTGSIAAAGNLLVAAVVFGLQFSLQSSPPAPTTDRPALPPAWLLVNFGLSGACGLAYEVLWTRSLVFFIGSEIFVFSMILAVFLSGIALGAWIVQRAAEQHARPLHLLVGAQTLLGLSGLLSLVAIGRMETLLPTLSFLPHSTPWVHYISGAVAACVLVMLPATILMGATFPIYVRLGGIEGATGKSVGILYAANTTGSALGSLAAGFLLLPTLGLQQALFVVGLLNLALAAWAFLKTSPSPVSRVVAGAMWAAIGLSVLSLPPGYIIAHTYEARYGPLEFYREDLEGTVAVANLMDFEGSSFKRLIVNGFAMTGTTFKSRRYMKLLGHLPVLLHPNPRQALVICLGTGMTVSAVAAHPEIQSIDCVDLSRTVPQALPCFAAWNDEVWKDPRLHIHIDDGRHYLLTCDRKFDVITFEPPPPRNAGAVNLYSRDYYELCRARLQPNGLVCQWLPVHQMTPDDVKACIGAFAQVFEHATLWTNFAYTDLCLLGSPDPLTISPQRLRQKFADAGLRDKLAQIGIDTPESLLATFLKTPQSLRSYSRMTPPLTDDRPSLEYSYPQEEDIDLEWLLARRDPVEPMLADPPDAAALRRAHQVNDSIHQYYIDAMAHVGPPWREDRLGDSLFHLAPDNPYVRYALGSTDTARVLYDHALERDPRNTDVLLQRARWFRFRGQLDRAREDLLGYNAIEPDQPYPLLFLGMLELMQGHADASRGWFEKALLHGPDPGLKGELQRLIREVAQHG